MHPGEILWPLDGFVGENLSDSTAREKSKPQLQNKAQSNGSQKRPRLQRPFYSFYRSKPLLLKKAQFRSLNIKVQNVDYIVFSGEYNL